MYLVKSLFPVLFQLIILACDYTVDRISNEDKIAGNIFSKIKNKQNGLIKKIDTYSSSKSKNKEEIKTIYLDIKNLIEKEFPFIVQDI